MVWKQAKDCFCLEKNTTMLSMDLRYWKLKKSVTWITYLKSKNLSFVPENLIIWEFIIIFRLHDPIVPYIANGPQRQTDGKRMCSKFSYEDIREVHKRRYLLQPIALEVFSVDGRNYLLAFPKRVRNKVNF